MSDHSIHQEYTLLNGNKDIIVFVHGILGSPNQLRFLAECFCQKGYDCMALLLPGHGGTAAMFSGTPARKWPEYVLKRVNEARERYRNVFLVGHSLGGLICLECAASCGVAGIVLINAPLAFRFSLRQLAFSARIMLSRGGGRDDEFLKAYRDGFGVTGARLYEYPLWVRQFLGLIGYMHRTRGRLGQVRTRVMIVQSAKDESVQRRSAKMLKDGLVNADAEVVELGKSYHAHFPGKDRQLLLEAVERFVKSER